MVKMIKCNACKKLYKVTGKLKPPSHCSCGEVLRIKKCARCNKPIYDAEMAYVGKYYHEKCYDEEMKEL